MKVRPRPRLAYPDVPFHDFLRRAADRHGEQVAIRFDDEVVTFRELDARGTMFANALVAAGVPVRSRVAIASGNRPEWLMAEHGISQVGAATVLVNSSWKHQELAHAFELTRPVAVVADAAAARMIDGCRGPVPALRICFDDDAPDGWLSFWELLLAAPGTRPADLEGDLSTHEAIIPFSSGTTGLPKAVRHTHRSIVAATLQRVSAYGVTSADRLQYFMPLFTIYGVTVAGTAFAAGASMRLYRRFDAVEALRNLEAERITVAFVAAPVAVTLRDRADLEDHDLSSVRYFLWGATPPIPDVVEELTARTGVGIFQAYATTEVGIAANPVQQPDAWRLDSPGLLMSDVEARVVDLQTGEELPPGEPGELLVRSPAVMFGYLPEEDDETAFVEGWFRTGDIGWIESDGWVRLTDRAKEMIKCSGFAVAPAEIEGTLFAHPGVADCAVYGIPDPRRGEAPKAAVVRVAGAEVTSDELMAFVADRLATYKHLGAVSFVEAIPRNAGGKVLRRVLRDDD
ncbi:MAG TPA: AMP-binding protein, partial [Acidimicrobiales bacterium]